MTNLHLEHFSAYVLLRYLSQSLNQRSQEMSPSVVALQAFLRRTVLSQRSITGRTTSISCSVKFLSISSPGMHMFLSTPCLGRGHGNILCCQAVTAKVIENEIVCRNTTAEPYEGNIIEDLLPAGDKPFQPRRRRQRH